ncbi:hypothetical protein ZWY2020_047786 [Hordeum vulgare]|nr:hypothetical protein ZWY2020_047786 [Hordeum vulgare]
MAPAIVDPARKEVYLEWEIQAAASLAREVVARLGACDEFFRLLVAYAGDDTETLAAAVEARVHELLQDHPDLLARLNSFLGQPLPQFQQDM